MSKQLQDYMLIVGFVVLWALANVLSKDDLSMVKSIKNFVIAWFSWAITWMVAQLFFWYDVIWISVASGIWGYAGVAGLNKITNTVIDWLSLLIDSKLWKK